MADCSTSAVCVSSPPRRCPPCRELPRSASARRPRPSPGGVLGHSSRRNTPRAVRPPAARARSGRRRRSLRHRLAACTGACIEEDGAGTIPSARSTPTTPSREEPNSSVVHPSRSPMTASSRSAHTLGARAGPETTKPQHRRAHYRIHRTGVKPDQTCGPPADSVRHMPQGSTPASPETKSVPSTAPQRRLRPGTPRRSRRHRPRLRRPTPCTPADTSRPRHRLTTPSPPVPQGRAATASTPALRSLRARYSTSGSIPE